MYIDFKITTWERIQIPPEREKEVLAKLKSGEIECSNDLWNMDMNIDINYETLEDTSVQMTLKQNSFEPTIEVFMEKGSEPDWNNKINSKK